MSSIRVWKFTLLSFAFALFTCAARRSSLRPPDLIEQVTITASTDPATALAQLVDYLNDSPDDSVTPWAMLWVGELHRLNQDTTQARRFFSSVADTYPTHGLKEAALLGMAVIDAGDHPSGNTLATLHLLRAQGAPDSLNSDRYRILARVAANDRSQAAEIEEHIAKAIEYAGDNKALQIRIVQSLSDVLTEEQIQTLSGGALGAQGAGVEQGAYDRAEEALQRGDFEQAISLAEQFLSLWPESDLVNEVQYFIKRAEKGDPLSARTVGVLLPMSGRYAPAAQQFREVIELANQDAGSPMTLIFADTQGNEEQTLLELERLVLDEGCVAIIGPLLKEVVMPAAQRAQDMHVPLIALSQSNDPTAAGQYVFRGFLPLHQQISSLLTHTIESRDLQRYAVLYPDNSYGQTATELFVAAATEMGVEVVRQQSYDPAATDFLAAARELGDKESSSGNEREAKNPPTIDYDALFIPDNHQRVALVASSLAYEEFPVGSFRPTNDVQGLLLMGLNGWNNPAISEAGGQYVRGSVFVDAFWSASSDEAISGFVGSYRENFGRTPGVWDAVTYDATRLVAAAVSSNDGDRDAFLMELQNAQLTNPVSTGDRFRDDREMNRDLIVFTVTSSGVAPWVAPE